MVPHMVRLLIAMEFGVDGTAVPMGATALAASISSNRPYFFSCFIDRYESDNELIAGNRFSILGVYYLPEQVNSLGV